MVYSKYKAVAAVLTCGLGLGIGAYQFAPQPVAAQPPARAVAATPDLEPIDPTLVFDPQVQKDLRLSENQVRRLTEARDKGRAAVADRAARVKEIDQRTKELQDEINRLQEERNGAQVAVDKAEAAQVKGAIPGVLSRDAVEQLRQITLRRMALSDILLDPKVRARLGLNDEQVKKIQDLADKRGVLLGYGLARVSGSVTLNEGQYLGLVSRFVEGSGTFLVDSSGPARGELLKLLTPAQRSVLEKMTGTTFEKDK
jgi:hypothetical protein